MCAHTAVADFMWPAHLGGPRTREQVADMLHVDAAHWTAKAFGMWVLRDVADDGRVVGEAGLQYTVVAGRAEVEVGWFLHPDVWGRGYATELTLAPHVEVGWFLHPDVWGRGYATELTLAALELAPAIRGLRSVVAFTMVENARARATMERCGFAYEADTTVVELPHVLHRRVLAG